MWLAYIEWHYFFLQIICTSIKLIFVFNASVEIPVRDKMGCWNEVHSFKILRMTCKKMEQLKWFLLFPILNEVCTVLSFWCFTSKLA